MKFFAIIFFMLTIPLASIAQRNNWLQAMMKNADSILLVSHEVTAGVAIIDKNGKKTPLPKLMVDGMPNFAIIIEHQVISGAKLDTLIKILERPFSDRQIEMSKCFIPHHAIFIMKNGNASFIEICFGCHRIDTSTDLGKLDPFDKRKWKELEEFFIRLGFTYNLGDEN